MAPFYCNNLINTLFSFILVALYKSNWLFHWSKSILRLVPLYSNRFSLDIPSDKSN